jgi:hypothetical protein
VWIEGNHDEGISHILSSLIGATVYDEYLWEFDGKKCLAVHGDQFDEFYRDHFNLVEWGTWAYQSLQTLGPTVDPIYLYLKNNSRHYARAINIVLEPPDTRTRRGPTRFSAGTRIIPSIKKSVTLTTTTAAPCNRTSARVSLWAKRESGFIFSRMTTA